MRSIRVMRPLEVLTRFDELLGVVCEDPSCLVEWRQESPQNKMLFLVRVCLSLDLSASNTSLCLVR